jgi:hypothetical protein
MGTKLLKVAEAAASKLVECDASYYLHPECSKLTKADATPNNGIPREAARAVGDNPTDLGAAQEWISGQAGKQVNNAEAKRHLRHLQGKNLGGKNWSKAFDWPQTEFE